MLKFYLETVIIYSIINFSLLIALLYKVVEEDFYFSNKWNHINGLSVLYDSVFWSMIPIVRLGITIFSFIIVSDKERRKVFIKYIKNEEIKKTIDFVTKIKTKNKKENENENSCN